MRTTLNDPVTFGPLRLKNRAVMPAMGTGYGSPQGEPTPRLLAYLARRAEGGVGLLITEVCAVDSLGRGFPNELCVHDDRFIPALSELALTVKRAGATACLQLHHAGRETFSQVIGEQPLGPSAIASRTLGVVPREMSLDDISRAVDGFGKAARRAAAAGFDAVEIHGAHGYLVNQFLSPYSNQRQDDYGGDTTGRWRFAREVVEAVAEQAGRELAVIFRLSSSELVRGGYELDDVIGELPALVELGVNAFHVSCGVYDSPGNPICPGMHHPYGLNLERAARIKEATGVPVIVAGKMHDLGLADAAIGDGRTDLVAFGRQHLADPHFLAKAWEGRADDIRRCLACNQGCIERLMFQFRSASCTINPECGEEYRNRPSGATGPFLVVGAGPAGLQAAITLAERGASVTVLEREREAGGQLLSACKPPGKEPLTEWLAWARRRLAAAGVELRLGSEMGELPPGEWNGIVVATGSRPAMPELEHEPGCPEVVEARAWLRDGVKAPGCCVIVGAGPVGMETADLLLELGAAVTVIDTAAASPVLALSSHGYHLHHRLRKEGRLLLSTRLVELRQGGVLVEGDGAKRELPADLVVWAAGAFSQAPEIAAEDYAGVPIAVVGDAREPRGLFEAVREGWRAGCEIEE
ncbi:MAG: oxidoreductase [Candidatus Geothermincolia bacterium]